jgi:hypothetical protein
MKASQANSIEAWVERRDKDRCLRKCITGGAGMPVGPCREEKSVTVSDIFADPRIITDNMQIFRPRANQVEWLKKLKGRGDSYVQSGGWAFALKQINYKDQVIVLMFKEDDRRATQFFVDGETFAKRLRYELQINPRLFDSETRPQLKSEYWAPEDPCDYENPAECCCYYQDRKFVEGYFYDKKYSGAGCTGQHIDDCGEDLNPNPGMMWFRRNTTTGETTWTDWKGNTDTPEAEATARAAAAIGLDPSLDYDWDNKRSTMTPDEQVLDSINRAIAKVKKSTKPGMEALLKTLEERKKEWELTHA